jgi:hypothetical protein
VTRNSTKNEELSNYKCEYNVLISTTGEANTYTKGEPKTKDAWSEVG